MWNWGLTNGLEAAGINVIKGYDNDKSVAYAYDKNNKSEFVLKDITKLKGEEIKKLFKSSKKTLIAGCAPCQPFSSYQKNKSIKARQTHYKYPALEHFIRLVKEVRPTFVTMENVRGIQKDENFKYFVKDLKKMKYFVDYAVINIANYGAPQNRHRLLLVASRSGVISISKNIHKKPISVKEAIKHLSKIKAGEIDKNDPLHRSSKLSPLNIKRIQHSKPGGTWRDWPKKILPNCYKKDSGSIF